MHGSYRCLIPGGKTCQAECIHTFAYKSARSYTLQAANSAHISEHCSGARAVEHPCLFCCPKRCKLPVKLMGHAPPQNKSSACENSRALRQTCPPWRSTVTPFQCLRNNSWFPRCSTVLRPHLCQGACLPMTVRRMLSSTLVQ